MWDNLNTLSLNSLNLLFEFSVANNNLYGPIPSGTQFQSFDALAYEGNSRLCGPLLPHKCSRIVGNDRDIHNEHDEPRITWFSITVVLGFFTDFWEICGSLTFGEFHISNSSKT